MAHVDIVTKADFCLVIIFRDGSSLLEPDPRSVLHTWRVWGRQDHNKFVLEAYVEVVSIPPPYT